MARRLTAWLMLALIVAPGAGALTFQYKECDEANRSRNFCSPEGETPDLVSSHVVYYKRVQERQRFERDGDGRPTDFAAIAGYFFAPRIEKIHQNPMRECVVWFNGNDLVTPPLPDGGNRTSDEDQPRPADSSYQDYDFDRDVPGCDRGKPFHSVNKTNVTGSYAIAVERGDCHPAYGRDYQFRAHLDYVDPNGIYHEVQEYDYICGQYEAPNNTSYSRTGRGNSHPGVIPGTIGVVEQMVGRNLTFLTNAYRERLWITPIHDPVLDPTIGDLYTFAMLIDTCDRSCTDGSSGSFDDTNRGTTVHDGPPPGIEDIMRGNSYGPYAHPNNSTEWRHRDNCRSEEVRWIRVQYPPGTDQDSCYTEDHRTAQADLYIAERDPTGLFDVHTTGLTGPNQYNGTGHKGADQGSWGPTGQANESDNHTAPGIDEPQHYIPDDPDDAANDGEEAVPRDPSGTEQRRRDGRRRSGPDAPRGDSDSADQWNTTNRLARHGRRPAAPARWTRPDEASGSDSNERDGPYDEELDRHQGGPVEPTQRRIRSGPGAANPALADQVRALLDAYLDERELRPRSGSVARSDSARRDAATREIVPRTAGLPPPPNRPTDIADPQRAVMAARIDELRAKVALTADALRPGPKHVPERDRRHDDLSSETAHRQDPHDVGQPAPLPVKPGALRDRQNDVIGGRRIRRGLSERRNSALLRLESSMAKVTIQSVEDGMVQIEVFDGDDLEYRAIRKGGLREGLSLIQTFLDQGPEGLSPRLRGASYGDIAVAMATLPVDERFTSLRLAELVHQEGVHDRQLVLKNVSSALTKLRKRNVDWMRTEGKQGKSMVYSMARTPTVAEIVADLQD